MKIILFSLGGIVVVVITIFIHLFLDSCKYESILQKNEDGLWTEVPAFHPCGEPIDEDFIKLWHERKEEYKKDMKKSKIKY